MKILVHATRFARIFAVLVLLQVLTACVDDDVKATRYINQGIEYYEEEDFESAVLKFRSALKIDPTNSTPKVYLARMAEESGEIATAMGMYLSILDQDPTRHDARVELGRIYLQGYFDTLSVEEARKVLEDEPDNPEANALVAAVALRRSNLAEAYELAQKVRRLDPGNVRALATLAGVEIASGDVNAALELIAEEIDQAGASVELLSLRFSILDLTGNTAGQEEVLRQIVEIEPSAEHRLALAQFFARESRFDAAEAELEAASEADPEDLSILTAWADLAARRAGTDSAVALYQAFIDERPDQDRLKFALSTVLADAGRTQEAVDVLRGVADLRGDELMGLLARAGLAKLAFDGGQDDTARALTDGILAINSAFPDALMIRAALSAKAGDHRSAIADLRSVLSSGAQSTGALRQLSTSYAGNREYELAAETLLNYLVQAPDDIPARVQLALIEARLGQLRAASERLAEVLRVQPDNIEALRAAAEIALRRSALSEATSIGREMIETGLDPAGGAVVLAFVRLAQDNLEGALEVLQEGRAAMPESDEIVLMEAAVLVQLGRDEEALSLAQNAAEIGAGSAPLALRTAELLEAEGRDQEALEWYRRSVDVERTTPQAVIALSGFYAARDQIPAAADVLVRGLDAFPTSEVILVRAARIEERLGNVEAAAAVYRDLLREDSRSLAAANNLALLIADHLYQDPERMAEARRLAEQFRDSTNPSLLDTLAWVQFRSDNIEDALALLEIAVAEEPDSPQLHYHLGRVHEELGEADRAKQSYLIAV
ncbi:MAG: tetratricopeptide repeat protein, partial [Pseudomonadota bacterium]